MACIFTFHKLDLLNIQIVVLLYILFKVNLKLKMSFSET